MNAVERLDQYLQALRRRLKALIYVRGAALAILALLSVSIALIWWLERNSFSSALVWSGRALLCALMIAIVGSFLWWPLHKLRRGEGSEEFERLVPAERGRLATYLDARGRGAQSSPLLELLADDAERIAASRPVESVVPRRHIQFGALVAALSLTALALLLTLAPDHWGFGSRYLLLGAELPREVIPVRTILVKPGNATVRRNSDLAIQASLEGFAAPHATVYVRFDDQTQWERAPMQAGDAPGTFAFKLYALRSPAKYYVEADNTHSAEHSITVADLPRIDRVRLTYHYPQWTGLDVEVDEARRDIRAVAGTRVTIEVQSDVPLEQPVLIHDDEVGALESRNGANAGTLEIVKKGQYRIAASVAGERVALTDDYAIDIVPDEKPVVEIERPARDWRATNIEEVPVRVRAEDDFRLKNVELRYSVNGGAWRALPLDRGVKQTREQTLLELEKLGAEETKNTGAPLLSPGDLVSYYAVATDHKRSVQTDLFMVQVQPFERRFLQQNAGGGGGGMSDEQGAISERQREILLATWNLQRSDEKNRQSSRQLEDNAKMLAEMQMTLAQQARTLAARTRARASEEGDERIKNFVDSLDKAALAMDPAALHLSSFELDKAVPVEQQALQQLLRAEAAFREVQVSMQSQDGAQGSRSARDFGEMFELEMDVEKSQYESESQFSEEDQNEEMNEALRKLKELAERQERLAQEVNSNTLTPEQKWQQEQLRREAEDLRRRLASMNQQQSQSQSRSQSGSQSQSGPSQGSEQSESPENALESMDRALSQMQAANAEQRKAGEEQSDAAKEASKSLRQAVKQLDRPASSGLDEALDELAERASGLADQQRQIESDLYEALREGSQPRPGDIDPQRAQSLVETKQQMAQDLENLQKELRSSVHEYRSADEDSKRRLAEIVNDVESSDLMYRMRRSAAEIYYGRARDAAAREGIITESLQALEDELKDAAAQAGREGKQQPGGQPATDQLLAEVADLRRRVQQRERMRVGQSSAQGSESEQGTRESQQAETERQRGGVDTSEGDRALSVWDPVLPDSPASDRQAQGENGLTRQSTSIADRARRMRERVGNRELTAAELASLSGLARELRQLAGDPLSAQSSAMKQALAQIELAALTAFANSARSGSARTTVPAGDSPEYQEAVAEYYRRLGGS